MHVEALFQGVREHRRGVESAGEEEDSGGHAGS
jgi:hypothetical protein